MLLKRFFLIRIAAPPLLVHGGFIYSSYSFSDSSTLAFNAFPHSVSSIMSNLQFRQFRYEASSCLCRFKLLMFRWHILMYELPMLENLELKPLIS